MMGPAFFGYLPLGLAPPLLRPRGGLGVYLSALGQRPAQHQHQHASTRFFFAISRYRDRLDFVGFCSCFTDYKYRWQVVPDWCFWLIIYTVFIGAKRQTADFFLLKSPIADFAGALVPSGPTSCGGTPHAFTATRWWLSLRMASAASVHSRMHNGRNEQHKPRVDHDSKISPKNM